MRLSRFSSSWLFLLLELSTAMLAVCLLRVAADLPGYGHSHASAAVLGRARAAEGGCVTLCCFRSCLIALYVEMLRLIHDIIDISCSQRLFVPLQGIFSFCTSDAGRAFQHERAHVQRR